jgi:hypothetical protein
MMDTNSKSRSVSRLAVRALQASDWQEISTICRQYPGWTPPSRYLMWVLVTFMPDLSLVVEDRYGLIVGYLLLLKLPTIGEYFAWQLGLRSGDNRQMTSTALAIMRAVSKSCRKINAQRIHFSADPKTMLFLNAALRRTFKTAPVDSVFSLPPEYTSSEGERLFTLNLQGE